jgi:hydroxymethylpyrimidine/phosphomethylpyrimidine kinase
VAISTSGSNLSSDEAYEALKAHLLPIAALATPNIPEAELLSGMKIASEEDMLAAAKTITEKFGCNVLVKGGHSVNEANDVLYRLNGSHHWFTGKRVDNPNTHGTGCTLSSAVTANLAKGLSMPEAIQRAKDYISGALGAMLDLGHGSGPLDHMFDLKSKFAD